MVYETKCPYRGKGNKNCSHKGCPKHCAYVKHPEKCKTYIGWVKGRKMDSTSLETFEELNLMESDNA